jgi:uncharacterized protein with FMN-binding domain
MGIALYRRDSFKSGDCINCFECTAACPRKNVSLAVSQGDVRPVIAGAMAVAVMTGVYYAGSFEANALTVSSAIGTSTAVAGSASSQSSADSAVSQAAGSDGSQSSSASSSAPSDASSKYKDGTYQGSGTGYRGRTTTVSVTIKGGKIVDVAVVSTGDTMRFFDQAYPVITQSIMSSQKSNVDAVSGATYSSNGIMQAVADALNRASQNN